MKRLLCLSLFIAVPALAAEPTDADRIKGTWIVEAVRVNGRDGDPKRHSWVGEPITFEDGFMRFSFFGKSNTYKIDATTTPRRLDITLPKHPPAGKKTLGALPVIYKFDGARLSITLGITNEEDRPTSFDLAAGPPFFHVTLTRAKH